MQDSKLSGSEEQRPDARRRLTSIHSFENGELTACDDDVALERVLEIHVAGAAPLITMRTPGDDRALAVGLLHSEGVIDSRDDIVDLRHAPDQPDVVRLMLRPEARARLERIERNTVATSACGVCGKPRFRPPRATSVRDTRGEFLLTPQFLLALPGALRASQDVFASTGGLHAAGLFDVDGTLVDLCEDVGRHNALDKVIGHALQADQLPLTDRILMLSGRASYELLQKSVMAGLRTVCAISAPSSYAVDLARQFDVTLVGFLRDNRFNVYAGVQRIVGAPQT